MDMQCDVSSINPNFLKINEVGNMHTANQLFCYF